MTLYWSRLRHRWVQELLAVAGIAVGVSLIYASQVANSSMSGPVRQLNHTLVGASQLQLVARGPAGFPQRLTPPVRGPIRRAAPVLEVAANLAGPRGQRPIRLVGADPRTIQLRGGMLHSLMRGLTPADAARQRLLAVPEPIAHAIGVRFGDRARVEIAGVVRSAPVAVIGQGDAGPLLHTAVAVAPLAYVQELARLRGRVSRILVEARAGTLAQARALLAREAAANDLDLRAADYEERVFAAASQPTSQSTAVAGLVCGLVGFLFAFCAMQVSAPGRRRLALELSLDGFSAARIVRIMAADALGLAAVGVAAGLAAGEALSRHGFRAEVGFLSGGFPVGDERIVTPQSVALAAGAGVAAAFAGVLAPLGRRQRAPVREPRSGTHNRGSVTLLATAAGLLAIAIAVLGTIAVPGLALAGLFALVLAVVLLLPAFLHAAIQVLAAASARAPRAATALELALANLRAREGRGRSLAIAATGAVAVVGAVSLHAAQVNLQAGLDRVTREVSGTAAVWVAPRGPGDLFGTLPFSAQDRARLASAPGVRRVDLYRGAMLDVAGQRLWVIGAPAASRAPIPGAEVVDGARERAQALVHRGGWISVPKRLAVDLHLGLGGRVTLPTPVPIALRVAAMTTNIGWPPGTLVMSGRDFARAWHSRAIGAYEVQLAPRTPAVRAIVALRRALGDRAGLFRIEAGAQRAVRQQGASHGGLARLRQVALLIQIAAVLAMATTMAGLLWQRRVEVARLKLDGHRSAALWRALAAECAALFGTGCMAGALLGLGGAVLLTRWVEAAQGFPAIVAPRIGLAATSFGFVTGAAVLVVAVPGYFVARVAPSLQTGE